MILRRGCILSLFDGDQYPPVGVTIFFLPGTANCQASFPYSKAIGATGIFRNIAAN